MRTSKTWPFALALAVCAVLGNRKSAAQRGADDPPRIRAATSEPSSSRTIRVAAAQPRRRSIDWRIDDPATVLERVERSLEELAQIVSKASEAHCNALAFPEDTLGLLNWEAAHPEQLKEVLEPAVKRMMDRLGRAAAVHKMYLVVCNDAIEQDGAVYNTAFLVGRDGKEIGRYHKVNLPIQEQSRARGNHFPVFVTPDLGSVGMLICYDMVFPEAARCLALAGADVIFVPTLGGAAVTDDEEVDRAAFRTRAVENYVYLVVAARGGGSKIVSPKGKIIAEAKGVDSLAIAEIDPRGGREGGDSTNRQRDMRARLFRERWPAAFGMIVNPSPPVLEKVPASITREEAVRIFSGILTVGDERFQKANELARTGRIEKAIKAFEELIRDYPASWIDRAAKARVESLRKAATPPPGARRRESARSPNPSCSDAGVVHQEIAKVALP
jgi:predicted amidohydrolase